MYLFSVEDHKKLLSTVKLPENPSVDMLQKESCKLKFTVQLLEMLHSTGHRTLLFSTSLKILDYVQSMIAEEVTKYYLLLLKVLNHEFANISF